MGENAVAAAASFLSFISQSGRGEADLQKQAGVAAAAADDFLMVLPSFRDIVMGMGN